MPRLHLGRAARAWVPGWAPQWGRKTTGRLARADAGPPSGAQRGRHQRGAARREGTGARDLRPWLTKLYTKMGKEVSPERRARAMRAARRSQFLHPSRTLWRGYRVTARRVSAVPAPVAPRPSRAPPLHDPSLAEAGDDAPRGEHDAVNHLSVGVDHIVDRPTIDHDARAHPQVAIEVGARGPGRERGA